MDAELKESKKIAVPSLKTFFRAHGAGIGEKRIIKPFHEKMFSSTTAWMAGRLPGGKKNLAIHIPPGHTKTYLARDTIAYGTGLWPDSWWLYTSYGADLAIEQTARIKNTLSSEWYRSIFPWVKVKGGEKNKFYTEQNGFIYGVGATGAVTGFRGGLKREYFSGGIVIDDPLKSDEARSETARKHLWDWYNGVILNRKNRDDTPILLIAQRLHPEDLSGKIKEKYADQWHFLEIPAVDEENKTTIWPETFSYESAMRLKEVDPFAYYSQYQQQPIIPGGSLIKEDWWQYYDDTADDIKKKCSVLFMTADTAYTAKETSDFSVVQLWGISGRNLYLIDQIRGKWEYEILLEKVVGFWEKHSRVVSGYLSQVDRLFIEDKASGLALLGQVQLFRDKNINAHPWNVSKYVKDGESRGDKVARVNLAKMSVYAGHVFLPSDSALAWVDDFIAECSAFSGLGSAVHDDMVDTMTMAVLIYQSLGIE